MKNSIEKIAKKNVILLQPYQSARVIGGKGAVWLNANEFPKATSFTLNNTYFNRYPEFQSKKLILKYSYYSSISPENILVSRGADEAIDLLMKVFCIPRKDYIMTFPPTYAMYSKIAEIYDIKNKIIFINKKEDFKISYIINHLQDVKLIYICRPNNPTGYIIKFSDIINILNITLKKSLIIIDEAYIEFCDNQSIVSLVKRYSNLVILRTLSKSFGLSGIRCGFTLSNINIINLLRKVIAPYPLPSPVIDIAIQALNKNFIKIMKDNILELNKNKLWLLNNLKKICCIEKIFDSSANYILVKTVSSKNVFKILWDQGIIVRNQNHEHGLNGCIRISIGTKKECIYLIDALKNIK